jgi:phosphate transport system permease protein
LPGNPLDPVGTLTATIAAELGEAARGGEHYKALFAIGVLLFAITFVIDLVAEWAIRGRADSQHSSR